MTASTIVAGVDIGKFHLDAHLGPSGESRRFDNDPGGRHRLLHWLLKHGVEGVVLEPTGRYHRRLHQDLHQAGLEVVRVNPLRSRRFAEAIGKRAKTDRVDAALLARFGRLTGLRATPPQPGNLLKLRDLLALRRKLVQHRAALQRLNDELECAEATRQV